MAKKKVIILPKYNRILVQLGEHIKLARLRRKLSAEQVSERANITRPTLSSIERGAASVGIGHYLQVLIVLGLEKDLLEVGKDDELGRKLMDAQLIIKQRAPKRKSAL